MLEIRHISAAYHKDYPILSDINMSIGDGEKLVILGRNGAGKTTFAGVLFGLIPIISGEIIFQETDVLALALEELHSLGMAYFMQGAPVFPQMTVKENLRVSAGDCKQKEFLLRYQELKEFFPILKDAAFDQMLAGSLSGGERTQLCVAMSIFRNPSLVVLDEPFAGLSPTNASLILNILNEFQEASKATMLLIAQDRFMAKGFSNEQYILRDGKLIKDII